MTIKPRRFNHPMDFKHVGRQAGEARKMGDESRAKFESEHFRKMLAMEHADYRSECYAAYAEGYKLGSGRL